MIVSWKDSFCIIASYYAVSLTLSYCTQISHCQFLPLNIKTFRPLAIALFLGRKSRDLIAALSAITLTNTVLRRASTIQHA